MLVFKLFLCTFTSESTNKTDMIFDSKEEMYFSWYLDELKEKGYIKDYSRSLTYTLSESKGESYIKPMKRVSDKTLTYSYLRGHEYTPDFFVIWTPKALGVFIKDDSNFMDKMTNYPFMTYIKTENKEMKICSEIEVKPMFDQNNMTRLAMINIKWLYEKEGILTTVAKPQKVFKDTFTPNRYLTTDKSGKGRKINWKVKTLEDFINK